MMRYKFSQTDTTLNLDDKFELPKEGKWRGQKLKIRVYVPEGKRVTFADNMDQMEASVKGNDYFDDGFLSGKILRVESGKIKCLNCTAKVITDDGSDESDESDAGRAHKSAHASIQTNGSGPHNLNDVSVSINQNRVTVSGKDEKDEKVKVKVDEHGVRVITTDTNGNTTIHKK